MAVHTSLAQPPRPLSGAEIDSIVNPQPLRGSVLQFLHPEVRLEAISEDDPPRVVSFAFTNQGDHAILIERVAATCGCIKIAYDRAPILPGHSGAIQVTFDPQGHPGTLLRKVFVYTNVSQKSPSAQLTLTGNVAPSADPWRDYPIQLGPLRSRQRSVTFRAVKRDQKRVECVECVNGGAVSLQLSARELPPYLQFRTSNAQLAPGATADLIFLLDVSKLPPDAPRTLVVPVVLEGLNVPQTQRTLQISITQH